MKNRLYTIDGETLMNMPLQNPPFVIEGLMGQGLYLLSGSPKVGKSWLALWLSVSIAKGEPVWEFSVRQGTTLYLCLEDSMLRIQNRLFEITEEAPSSVHFCTEAEKIGQGLEQQLEKFLSEHPDTVLIIIDTLQMVRGGTYDNTYSSDYRELSHLKQLADSKGIAILLIHHLRKENDKDPFNRISGTTGIMGSADGSFVLLEDRRGSGHAVLHCVGRDIVNRELTLRRTPENIWEKVSDSQSEPEQPPDRLVCYLRQMMENRTEYSGTISELAGELNQLAGSNSFSNRVLSKNLLQRQGELKQVSLQVQSKRSNKGNWVTIQKACDGGADTAGASPDLGEVVTKP